MSYCNAINKKQASLLDKTYTYNYDERSASIGWNFTVYIEPKNVKKIPEVKLKYDL